MSDKVAISLQPELLARVERLRKATGESRSAVMARALKRLLQDEALAEQRLEYVEAYRRLPETERDVRAARALARRALPPYGDDE